MYDLCDLSRDLRRYANTEHGKRSRIHNEIMRGVISNPDELATQIGDIIHRAAMNTIAALSPDEKAQLRAVLETF